MGDDLLKLLEGCDDDGIRALVYDTELDSALAQDHPDMEHACEMARRLAPIAQSVIDQERHDASRFALHARMCITSMLTDYQPPVKLEPLEDQMSWEEGLLFYISEASHCLASEGDTTKILTKLSNLPERQAEQEARWLKEAPSKRVAAIQLVGLYNAVAGIRAACEAVAAVGPNRSRLLDKAIRSQEHVANTDNLLGPSSLTHLPRPALMKAALNHSLKKR